MNDYDSTEDAMRAIGEADTAWFRSVVGTGPADYTGLLDVFKADGDGRTYMDHPKAAGAPEGSRWGYLPCGCSNDGYGRHVR